MSQFEISLHAADQDIINCLKNPALRRKGEEDLFNRYAYLIREGIKKNHLLRDEAFDAYSDTVITAIEQIIKENFEGRSSLKTWMFQIFHNKCVDLVRKKTTNKQAIHHTASITDMVFQLSDDAKSVIQKLVDQADRDLLRLKLNELGQTCRQLLMLSADGYSDKEIAVSMEYKTTDVVKTSRLRCLDRLRQLYNRK